MIADTGKISAGQLKFSVACFVQSSVLLSGFFAKVSRQDSWISVLMGFALFIPVYYVYHVLLKQFPGKSLLQIGSEVFGKAGGRIMAIFYAFFFWSLSALNTRDVGNFVTNHILPETPLIFVMAFFIIVCIYAVRKGVETITRYSYIFVVITFVVLIGNGILLIKDMKYENFLPMMTYEPIKYVQSAHNIASISFGEVFVFLIMVPNVSAEKASFSRVLFFGVLIGAASLLFTVLRDVAVLGSDYMLPSVPSYGVVRNINIADIFTRMEIFYALIMIILHFFKVSILLYGTMVCISHAFNLKSFYYLVPIMGALTVFLGVISFDSAMVNAAWGASESVWHTSFYQVALPVLLLITLGIKSLFKKKAAA